MSSYEGWLEKVLLEIKPYSKAYYVVKRVVDSWGHWRPLPKGGAFRPGYDERRHKFPNQKEGDR